MSDDAEPVLGRIDWRLRSSGTLDLIVRWVFLVGMGTVSLAAVASLVGLKITTWDSGDMGRLIPVMALQYVVFAAFFPIAFERLAVGPGGWWRRARDLVHGELPVSRGNVRGKFHLLSGLSLRHWRPAVLVIAPHRIVLVSRGWSPTVLTVVLVFVVLLAMPADGNVLVTAGLLAAGLFIGWLFALLAGRRVEVHEIPYGQIESVRFDFREAHLAIRVHGMPRFLQFRPFEDRIEDLEHELWRRCRHAFVHSVASSWPPAPLPVEEGDHATLARLQQRYQED